MFRKLRNDTDGFTLVELLVVIIIIGILAAVAIPAFLNQRQRANDAAVKADVKNVSAQVETLMTEMPNATSFSIAQVDSDNTATFSITGTAVKTGTVTLTKGVTVALEAGDKAGTYKVYGWHENGKQYTGKALVFDSDRGGIQKDPVDIPTSISNTAAAAEENNTEPTTLPANLNTKYSWYPSTNGGAWRLTYRVIFDPLPSSTSVLMRINDSASIYSIPSSGSFSSYIFVNPAPTVAQQNAKFEYLVCPDGECAGAEWVISPTERLADNQTVIP